MPDRTPDHEGGERIAEQLRRLRWALAIIAGLAGAIAVQLTFVAMWLPRLVIATRITGDSADALAALADVGGFVLFFLLALGVDRPAKP